MKESIERFSMGQEVLSSQPLPKQEKIGGKKESPPAAEAVRSIGLMEDVARARIELEDEILNNNIRPSGWLNLWEQKIRPRYPSLQPYGKFFTSAIEVALSVHQSVKDLYEDTKKSIIEKLEALGGGSCVFSEVMEGLDKALFRKMFGRFPKGQVLTEQGAVSLDFLIFNDEDFVAAFGTNQKMAKSVFGFQVISDAVKGKKVPVVGVRFEKGAKYILSHELEHVKNELLSMGRGRALDIIMEEKLDPAAERIAAKVGLREKRSLMVENLAKDEIIAQLKGEPEVLKGDNKAVFLDSLFRALATSKSYYYRYFFGVHEKEWDKDIPLFRQKRIYLDHVPKALSALEDLLNLYAEGKKQDTGGRRMVIGILEQFPLRSWPAVVRLLKMKHKKGLT